MKKLILTLVIALGFAVNSIACDMSDPGCNSPVMAPCPSGASDCRVDASPVLISGFEMGNPSYDRPMLAPCPQGIEDCRVDASPVLIAGNEEAWDCRMNTTNSSLM